MFRFVSAGLFVLATLPLAGCSSEPAPGTEHKVSEEAKAQAAKANTDPKAMMESMKKTPEKPAASGAPGAPTTPGAPAATK